MFCFAILELINTEAFLRPLPLGDLSLSYVQLNQMIRNCIKLNVPYSDRPPIVVIKMFEITKDLNLKKTKSNYYTLTINIQG